MTVEADSPSISKTRLAAYHGLLLSLGPVGLLKPRGEMQRFGIKVQILPSGCAEWLRAKTPQGYGSFSVNGASYPAHRWAYEAVNGRIPERLVIDHLCRNRACVNPAHLEAVPMGVNTQRGNLYETLAAKAATRTRCSRGHEFGPNDVDSRGDRSCRKCQRLKAEEWRQNNRERVNEKQRIRRALAGT